MIKTNKLLEKDGKDEMCAIAVAFMLQIFALDRKTWVIDKFVEKVTTKSEKTFPSN